MLHFSVPENRLYNCRGWSTVKLDSRPPLTPLLHGLLRHLLSHTPTSGSPPFMLDSHTFDCNRDFMSLFCNFYTVMSTICRQRQSSLNCSHSLTQCKVDGQRLACDCMQFVTCPALYLHGHLFFCPVVGGALLLFGLLMINNRFRMMLLICVEWTWTWISSLTQKQQWKSKALSVSCINTHILLWSRSQSCEVKFTAAAPRAEKRKWFLPSLLQEPGSSLLTSSFITFLIVMVINWHYW